MQRDLVDKFLDMYLPVVRSVRFGHPLAVAEDWSGGDPLPELDFGPLISAAKADELRRKVDEAVRGGAVPLYRGELRRGAVPGRPGHLRVRRAVGAAGPARPVPADARRAVRPGGHDRGGGHHGTNCWPR